MTLLKFVVVYLWWWIAVMAVLVVLGLVFHW